MVNKKFCLVILAIMLVFGITVVGCNDSSTGGGGGGTDYALNGTWVRTIPNDGYELTLNNGNFEGRYSNGVSAHKGTYTTYNETMKMKTTHWWVVSDAKWYTESEYQSAFPSDPYLDLLFAEYTWTYSISGNTFTKTRTYDSRFTETYTKKFRSVTNKNVHANI